MLYKNYNYDDKNYPKFSGEEINRNRFRIIEDAYWNARNLKSIIEESYDTSRTYRLPDRKEEMIFSLVALTCELYLKSLVYINKDQESIVTKHDLDSLYNSLPESIKNEIKELSKETDFDKKLNENKDVFVHFRYSYEMKGYKINATFLLNLMNTLSKLCDHSYPKEITDGFGGFYRCGYAANGVNYRVEIE